MVLSSSVVLTLGPSSQTYTPPETSFMQRASRTHKTLRGSDGWLGWACAVRRARPLVGKIRERGVCEEKRERERNIFSCKNRGHTPLSGSAKKNRGGGDVYAAAQPFEETTHDIGNHVKRETLTPASASSVGLSLTARNISIVTSSPTAVSGVTDPGITVRKQVFDTTKTKRQTR